MSDPNIPIHHENNRGRLSAAKLENLVSWMRLAQTPSPPQRLSAEQLSELLAQIRSADERTAKFRLGVCPLIYSEE
jgi:hypothetical protein